jgi:hypothetical protein
MPDLPERLANTLSPDHPANESRRLTALQEFALPVLMWFFDQDRSRATGRTRLAAHVCLQLAMRGQVVNAEDFSRIASQGRTRHFDNMRFLDTITEVIRADYLRHNFRIDSAKSTVEYTGKRPK